MNSRHSLQYPIGVFELKDSLSMEERSTAIETLARLSNDLMAAIDGLTPSQLETRYRPHGWTLRQLFHHIADSDMIAYGWMRLALTQDWPIVFAYDPAALAGGMQCCLRSCRCIFSVLYMRGGFALFEQSRKLHGNPEVISIQRAVDAHSTPL